MLQSGTSVAMAMPLRMLEVLTDTTTYTRGGTITEEEATDAVLDMYSFLIARGMFFSQTVHNKESLLIQAYCVTLWGIRHLGVLPMGTQIEYPWLVLPYVLESII